MDFKKALREAGKTLRNHDVVFFKSGEYRFKLSKTKLYGAKNYYFELIGPSFKVSYYLMRVNDISYFTTKAIDVLNSERFTQAYDVNISTGLGVSYGDPIDGISMIVPVPRSGWIPSRRLDMRY